MPRSVAKVFVPLPISRGDENVGPVKIDLRGRLGGLSLGGRGDAEQRVSFFIRAILDGSPRQTSTMDGMIAMIGGERMLGRARNDAN